MAQSTLEDDELFDEASNEMREDVEEALEEARDALPDSDDIFDVEGDNIIGVLNSLKSELDAGEAEKSLREAKKWFGIGRKADVFDEEYADETEEELEELEEALTSLSDAEETATELTDTLASLKSVL
ncbi:MAG: DUF5790 family protein [Halobacteriales archaeon]|nr:DUF5790 family protein [Halobacteriales archaeon]